MNECNKYPTYEKVYLLILNFFQAVALKKKMVIAFFFFWYDLAE